MLRDLSDEILEPPVQLMRSTTKAIMDSNEFAISQLELPFFRGGLGEYKKIYPMGYLTNGSCSRRRTRRPKHEPSGAIGNNSSNSSTKA